MPKRFSWWVCLACLWAFASPAPAVGQYSAGPSLEASFGVSRGIGGTFASREGIALDLLLGGPLRHTRAGTLVGALTAGVNGPVTSEDICVLGPGGECFGDVPLWLSAGALLGVQRGGTGGPSARLLAGPAFYRAAEGGSAFGLQGRLDVATAPLLPHTALVASLRGAMLPSYRGNTLGIAAFGLGVRIQ